MNTHITQEKKDGQNVPFSTLQSGDRVSVKVNREENQLKPITVKLLE